MKYFGAIIRQAVAGLKDQNLEHEHLIEGRTAAPRRSLGGTARSRSERERFELDQGGRLLQIQLPEGAVGHQKLRNLSPKTILVTDTVIAASVMLGSS
jgi:hypothetical protein